MKITFWVQIRIHSPAKGFSPLRMYNMANNRL